VACFEVSIEPDRSSSAAISVLLGSVIGRLSWKSSNAAGRVVTANFGHGFFDSGGRVRIGFEVSTSSDSVVLDSATGI
jgi:hypothetical protein